MEACGRRPGSALGPDPGQPRAVLAAFPRASLAPLSHGSNCQLSELLPPPPPMPAAFPTASQILLGPEAAPSSIRDPAGKLHCPSQGKAPMHTGSSLQPRGAEASLGNQQFGTHGCVITVSGCGLVPIRLSACPLPAGCLPPSAGLMVLRAQH